MLCCPLMPNCQYPISVEFKPHKSYIQNVLPFTEGGLIFMGSREIEVGNHKFKIQELNYICDSVTGCPLSGSWIWDSALLLARYISTHLQLEGKSVLELGAGAAGLPGLTAAALGAAQVLLTDIGPLLPWLLQNVEANGFGDRVQVKELVWGSEVNGVGEFDFVLMSDVFFDQEMMEGLGRTLKMCVGGKQKFGQRARSDHGHGSVLTS